MKGRKGDVHVKVGTLCFWCHDPIQDSPYRSPLIGGEITDRIVVCSPHCSQKPDGAMVYPISLDPFNVHTKV